MDKSVRRFLKFNGKTIYFLAVDGQYWIALNPICVALGMSWKNQHERLQTEGLFRELSREQGIVAADNKLRKMICLPERYVYGWIFQINSQSDELAKYQLACCDILFNHFHGTITQRREILVNNVGLVNEKKELEAELAENAKLKRLAEIKTALSENGKSLKKLDAELTNTQLSLFGKN